MSYENEQRSCPRDQEIGAMRAKIEQMHSMIEEIQNHVRANTTYRIATDNYELGKKEGIGKAVKIFNYLAHFIGSAILLGLLIAAGNVVGAIDIVVKFFAKL